MARGRLARSSCRQDTNSCACSHPQGQRQVPTQAAPGEETPRARLQLGPACPRTRSVTRAPSHALRHTRSREQQAPALQPRWPGRGLPGKHPQVLPNRLRCP